MYIVVYTDIFKLVDRFVYTPYLKDAVDLMIKLKSKGIYCSLYEHIL